MRIAIAFSIDALTVAVLWLAGEQHRQNCIRAGNVSCSVLPWDQGRASAPVQGDPLTRRDCLLLRRGERLGGSPAPAECRLR